MAIWTDLMNLFILKGTERAGEAQHNDIKDDDLVVQVSLLGEPVIEALRCPLRCASDARCIAQ